MNVAAITYDPVAQQLSFASASDIQFPLLSDQDAVHVNAYGVRNEEYPPGHKGYGIPHPGAIYFDARQILRLKFAIPGYRQRPPMAAILTAIEALEAD